MKKHLSLLLAAVLLFGFTACSSPAELTDFEISPIEPLAVGSTAPIEIGYSFNQELESEAQNTAISELSATISSSDETVATVDSATANVIATGQGVATLTVQIGQISKTLEITVFAPLESIDLGAAEPIHLLVDDKYPISVTPQPTQATLDGISFTSSDESIVTVSSTGEVVAVGAGSTAVTVACGEISNAISFEVAPKIESISFADGNTEGLLYIGVQHQLNPVVTPEEIAAEFEFVSSDEAIATVDENNGLISAKAAGTTIITVSVKGYPDIAIEYNLTVTARPASSGGPSGGNSGGGAGQDSGSGENGGAGQQGGSGSGSEAPPAAPPQTDEWGNIQCWVCGGFWHDPNLGHYLCWCGATHNNGDFHNNPDDPWSGGEMPEL